MKWFRKAADQGHAAAQYELAHLYRGYAGWHKSRDKVAAVMWYRKAADQGYSAALQEMWFIYEYGIIGVVDHGEAMEWNRKLLNSLQTEEESAAKKDAEKRLVK